MALNLNALGIGCHINHTYSTPSVCKIRSKVFMASVGRPNSMVLDNLKAPPTPDVIIPSMPPEKVEIFKSLDHWARNNILVHLKSVEESWQPQNYLPNPVSEGFEEQVIELRERAKKIPDDYFVVLVGDMVAEEALPTYMSYNNTLDGTKDESGADATALATWTTNLAEICGTIASDEKRHATAYTKTVQKVAEIDPDNTVT